MVAGHRAEKGQRRAPALSCYRNHLLNGSSVPGFRTPTEFRSTLGRFAMHLKTSVTISKSFGRAWSAKKRLSLFPDLIERGSELDPGFVDLLQLPSRFARLGRDEEAAA